MKFNLAEMLRDIERDTQRTTKPGKNKLTQAQIHELLRQKRQPDSVPPKSK